jgi:hypothetical protein
VKGNRRDPNLIKRSQAGAQSGADPDAEAAIEQERRELTGSAAVVRQEAAQATSLMGWLFAGAEHTPLFVITFLLILCFGLWAGLAIAGPDTPRVATLIAALERAATFFVGLFAGVSIRQRRR